jgi:hypothetical protein
MADEETWKRRFAVFMAARLFGLVTVLAGIAVAFTGLLRPGGWPAVGAVLVVLGLIDAVGAPMLLRKHWEREDRSE